MQGTRWVLAAVLVGAILLSLPQTGQAELVVSVHGGHFRAWVQAPFWPIVMPLVAVRTALLPAAFKPLPVYWERPCPVPLVYGPVAWWPPARPLPPPAVWTRPWHLWARPWREPWKPERAPSERRWRHRP